MTPEEAIEILKEDKGLYGSEICYAGDGTPEGDLIEALDMAIKVLKKQGLKKVLYEDVGYDTYYNVNVYACKCPSCELEIIKFTDDEVSDSCNSDDPKEMFRSSMVHHAYMGLNNYCNRCGQKLDWSEEE